MISFIIWSLLLIFSIFACRKVAKTHRIKFWDYIDDPQEGALYVGLFILSIVVLVLKIFYVLIDNALEIYCK